MKPTILIVHGAHGSPKENWIPWLKEKLGEEGFQVFVPVFPTPKNQTLAYWMEVFENYKHKIDEKSIIVGHSLGVAFLLNVLENQNVGAAFFVAGLGGKVDNEFWPGMVSFADRNFDWKKIRKNCAHFFVYHSDNDEYIPLEHAEQLARNLGTDVSLIPNAGHINRKSGYTKFPRLLEDLRGVLEK